MTSAIRTNMDAVRAHNIFASNNAQMTKAFNNVSTGLKINSVQDNPSDWAISEKMRERINSLNQAQQNVQNDTAMMKTAEGAISNTVDILRELRAGAVKGADASRTDEDRLNIAKEMYSLLQQIDYNATSTRYNGKLLLATTKDDAFDVGDAKIDNDQADGGTLTPLQFQIGDGNDAIISGIELQNMTVKGLGLSGDSLNVEGVDVYVLLKAIADPEGTLDDATIKTNVDAVFDSTNGTADEDSTVGKIQESLTIALKTALGAATDVGALEQRLGYTADNVSTQIENLQASDSAIRDADMANEVANYMKWNVLSQASQYMLAQSNQNAFSVLNLLQ